MVVQCTGLRVNLVATDNEGMEIVLDCSSQEGAIWTALTIATAYIPPVSVSSRLFIP